jgi:hypothetical protein
METLIIMNYESGLVYVTELPQNDWQIEDYEQYITEELGVRLSNVDWMVTKQENPIEYL